MGQFAARMGYYIANDGVQTGPFELNDLPQQGLRPDSLVWREGMPEWTKASAVPEVAAILTLKQIPSPTPASAPIPTQARPIPSAMPLQYRTAPPADTNGMAVASMVLGIISLPLAVAHCAGIITAILAIIFGFIAKAKIRRGETTAGSGMATAGLVLGFLYIGLLVGLIIIGVVVGFGIAMHSHHM